MSSRAEYSLVYTNTFKWHAKLVPAKYHSRFAELWKNSYNTRQR